MNLTDHEIRLLQCEVVLSDAILDGLTGINAALVEAELPTIDTIRDLEQAFGEADPDDDVTPDVIETLIIFETGAIEIELLWTEAFWNAVAAPMDTPFEIFGETAIRALAEKRVHEALGQFKN